MFPIRLLYLLSDWILYPSVYYLFRYRKSLVLRQLTDSFSEISLQKTESIAKQFYHHFCDLIIESIKLFHWSEQEILKRGRVTNPEILDSYFKQGKSVCITGGHYNNWEILTVAIDPQIAHQADGIYTKIQNQAMEQKISRSRSKLGMRLVPKREVLAHIETNKDEVRATIFATDQCPKPHQKVFWTEFLGQTTAVAFGAEKYSKQYDWPVFYGHIHKVKRGYYALTLELITEDPTSLPEGRLTQMHTQILESEIKRNPQYWLWTHNRWKMKKDELIS